MARVLIMGADIQSERAVIRRLQSICGSPSARMDMCHDVASCDLLVVQKDSAMRNVLGRIVRNRPSLPLWLLDREGRLADGMCTPEAPLSEDAIRRILLRITGRPAAAPQATEQAPDARSANDDAVRGVEALAPAVHRRMAERDGAAALRLDGRTVALLDFAAGVAVPGDAMDCPPDRFEHRLGELFQRLALHPIQADGGTAPADAVPRLPLARLLWKAALHLPGEDGPPALLAPAAALRLGGWPDFRMLAHHHDHFRLCSLLLKRSCTAEQAGHLLDIEAAAVRAFFNAAYLSGHATVTMPAAAAGPAAGAHRRGAGALLATMWRKVRGRAGN